MAPNFKVKPKVCFRLVKSNMISPPLTPPIFFSYWSSLGHGAPGFLASPPFSEPRNRDSKYSSVWTVVFRHPCKSFLYFLQFLLECQLLNEPSCLKCNPSYPWFSVTLLCCPCNTYNHKMYELILTVIVHLCLLESNLPPEGQSIQENKSDYLSQFEINKLYEWNKSYFQLA